MQGNGKMKGGKNQVRMCDMLDLILKNAKVSSNENLVFIGIENGKISQIQPDLKEKGKVVYDCQGRIVVPGFIDLHTHMEKTHLTHLTDGGNLMDAILAFKDYCLNGFVESDLIVRGEKMIQQCVLNGTSRLRTHVIADPTVGLTGIKAISFLKEKHKDILDIEIIVMMGDLTISQEQIDILHEASKYPITGYGGAPHICEEPKKTVDLLIDLALKYDKILDIHIDESDEANIDVLEYFTKRALKLNIGKSSTVGHITALSAVDEARAKKAIEGLKKAGINVVTLPSCNLYLMGRDDKGLIRRGTTRINELLDAGVNISLASDNIRDPFRPFGNGDLLEEALLTAQITQRGNGEGLELMGKMITENPAKACGLTDYGVKEGCVANLVVLDAPSLEDAILSQSTKNLVVHNGNIVVEKELKVKTSWTLGE